MKTKKTTLKEFLENELTKDEINLVNRSFEIVGDIAIIEIPNEIDKKSQIIGNALLKVNKNIKTVLKKSGIHKGEYRTQDLIHVAGENKKETIYKENGIKLKLDPQEVYFSSKLSTEREQLMNNLEEKKVLVMFSGCGPYTFVALKKQPSLKRILSIEINPIGHKYALENKELNKNLIKKSKRFNDIILFLKNNQLPIYEKKLIEIYNNLFINFLCLDVKNIKEHIKLKKYNTEIEKYDNELFDLNPTQTFNNLLQTTKKRLYLDIDKLKHKDNLIYLLTLFLFKFNYICKIENEIYEFSSDYHKGVLINYLEEKEKNIEKIELFDEIFMPLPKDASNFLDTAFKLANKNAIIHMYDFIEEKNFPTLTENKVISASKKYNKKIEILNTRKVGQYSPRKYRVCCDFKILD